MRSPSKRVKKALVHTPGRNPWIVRPQLVGLEDRTAPAIAKWVGDLDNKWATNTAGDTNWFNVTAATDNYTPLDGDELLFDDTAAGNFVNLHDLAALTKVAKVTITQAGAKPDYDIAADGTNKLTVSGDITVTVDGTLVGPTWQIPLTLGASIAIINSGAKPLNLTTKATVDLGANDLTVNATAGDVVIAGVISGTGKLIKDGTKELTLSGTAANTYTGATLINDGIVRVNITGGLVGIPGDVTVGDGTGAAQSAKLIAETADAIADTASVTVNADGLYQITGGVADKITNLTVNSGGVVDTTTGLLTVTGTATINGSAGVDAFVLTKEAGGVALTLNGTAIGAIVGKVKLDGLDGLDTLTAADVDGTFTITDTNAGTRGTDISFVNVENLTGGAKSDTFAFADGKGVTGIIDGGTAGPDKLDYSQYKTGVTVNLGSNSSSLLADLSADQEVPPTAGKGTGTATISNYDPSTNKFDLTVSVVDLPVTEVNGFHIHRAPVGVNGPIIVDLFVDPSKLVPDGGGFKFTATGLLLPAAHQAALLGGITYVNVHSKTNAGGEIRGQLFLGTAFADVPGVATGTGGIANIVNVVGSSEADSLVGSSKDNLFNGGGGIDTIVAAKGNDTVLGGDGDDVIVWNNGDGTDIMDGEAGNDLVQVNGSIDKADTFTIGANGKRVAFERTNLGPFKLDIGTTEKLVVNGVGGDDIFTVGNLTGIADLKGVALNGFAGSDTLIGPDATSTYTISGKNRGSVDTAVPTDFTGTENLTGGVGDDTFTFVDGQGVTGKIDGGGGVNELDYAKYTTAVRVNLGANAPGFAGTLGEDQEVPTTGSAANGTFSLTNYDPATGKFDLLVTVQNLLPGDVNGFHIHGAPFGVNGPIIVDLFGDPSKLVPSGTGFTFTATGLILPSQHEAALLGGLTYVNVHNKAFPGGVIRGQVFATGAFVAVPGVATGTGSIANISQVTGSTADDSLVGDILANTLTGGGGNDNLVGTKGNDTLQGGDGNDVMVWSNGDGTDIMDGGNGTDRVQVNGSFDKADEFTIAAKGTRVDFQRTTPGPFALDIGTTETLTVIGIGGDDKFTAQSLAGVTELTALNLAGLDGSDSFTVTPSATIAVNVTGSVPVPPTSPGDTLTVDTTGATGTLATGSKTATGSSGQVTFTNRSNVNFSGIETLSGVTLVTGALAFPFLVGPDTGGGVSVRKYDLNGKQSGSEFSAFDPSAGITGGVRVAVGDVNGDGIADSIVGNGPGAASIVRVLDGKTNAQIFAFAPFEASFTGGIFVSTADMNGDGKFDLIVSPDQGGGPRVRILDGAAAVAGTETVLTDYFGIVDPNFRGGARTYAGDINNDGTPDLLVAAGFLGGPRVSAWNGKSLLGGGAVPAVLFNDFFVFEQTLRNGVFVSVGDLNGDGFGDIIAGGGPGGGPRVFAVSGKDLITSGGATLTQLANFFAGDPNTRGGVRLAVRDIDGDGKGDIISGAGTASGSRVIGYAAANTPVQGQPTAESFTFEAFPGFTNGVFVG